jgi:hypothetical protein
MVVLDTGWDIPMLSKLCTNSHSIPLVTQTEPKIFENFNGDKVAKAGWLYTFSITP